MFPPQQASLKSSITPDSFLHIPQSQSPLSAPSSSNNDYIIFFIPGNPGLISYYHSFLSLLSDPKTSPGTSGCAIAGLSLGGFEVSRAKPGDGGRGEDQGQEKRIFPAVTEASKAKGKGSVYSLRQQIDLTAQRLKTLVETLSLQHQQQSHPSTSLADDDTPPPRCKVILIGHSVGAYIALEVLRMHRQNQNQNQKLKLWRRHSPPPTLIDHEGEESAPAPRADFEISAAVLLTPTIVDIALSSSGRVLSPLLRYTPGSPLLISLAARLITTLLPGSWLKMLVRIVMGADTPDGAVGSTIDFLRSKDGVRQSLGMARDEMVEIGGDGWGGEVWGVVGGEESMKDDLEGGGGGEDEREKVDLLFYFAKRDHWVADQTREAIIRRRGGKERVGRPRMVVAEADELVHGWCIRHSGGVAGTVDGWVEEIIKGR